MVTNAVKQKTVVRLPLLNLVSDTAEAPAKASAVDLTGKVSASARSKDLIKQCGSTGGMVDAVSRRLALGLMAEALRV
ncbi:MAG: hypothetical protein K2W95_33090 [Candidatus Obscuribacterales bacterium]|nr:hypothetical protein [Candidatus Obscuribacterales bacterium]